MPPDLARLLHDLRGPLNSAVIHLEVLKRTAADDPAAADSLRTVLQQLGRLADMLPAALAIAALEPGDREPVSLRAVVNRARTVAGLERTRVCEGPWPTVVGDAALLALAVEQLLRNALEASAPEAQAPEVSAAVADDSVVLAVRDWGAGLATTNPKLLVRLMHTTKPGHRGLGLITAERVARLHGGALGFEAPGQGARVTLTLPLAR